MEVYAALVKRSWDAFHCNNNSLSKAVLAATLGRCFVYISGVHFSRSTTNCQQQLHYCLLQSSKQDNLLRNIIMNSKISTFVLLLAAFMSVGTVSAAPAMEM
jgi:hypothetical protein